MGTYETGCARGDVQVKRPYLRPVIVVTQIPVRAFSSVRERSGGVLAQDRANAKPDVRGAWWRAANRGALRAALAGSAILILVVLMTACSADENATQHRNAK